MKPIEFTAIFNIGIKEIDAQHKQLIKLINQLAIELENPDGKQLPDHLSDMMNYALKHLVYEERLLQKQGYPDFENHLNEHQAFREKTVELYAIAKTDCEMSSILMHHYLSDWIVDHILNSDMAYKSFLKERKDP